MDRTTVVISVQTRQKLKSVKERLGVYNETYDTLLDKMSELTLLAAKLLNCRTVDEALDRMRVIESQGVLGKIYLSRRLRAEGGGGK